MKVRETRKTWWARRASVAGLAALAALLFAGADSAYANTYFADRLGDPTPNGCNAAGCTLREAAIKANGHAGPDTILLRSGKTYTLEIPGTGEDQAQTGDIDLRGRTTVRSNGFKHATVDATSLDRVFDTFAPAVFTRLTIQHGYVNGDAGGGIRAADALTVNRSAIRVNVVLAGGPYGGGIASFGAADVTLNRSRVSHNENDGVFQAGPGSARLFRTRTDHNTLDGVRDQDGGSIVMTGGGATGNGQGLSEIGPGSIVATGVTVGRNSVGAIGETQSGNVKLIRSSLSRGGNGVSEGGAGDLGVSRSTVTVPGDAIVERGRGNTSVSRSLIKKDPVVGHVGIGIEENDPGNLTVDRTKVLNTQLQGILESGVGDLTVTRSRSIGDPASHQYATGIREIASGDLHASRVNVANQNRGILEGQAGSADVSHAVVRNTDAHGISETDEGNLTVGRSKVSGSGQDGINESQAGNATISRSTISGADMSGISESDTGRVALSRTTVAGNGGDGVREQGDGSVTALRSTLRDNVDAGLTTFSGTGKLVARHLSALRNGEGGILIGTTDQADIAQSLIAGNNNAGDYGGGLEIYGGTAATIDSSTIKGNSTPHYAGGISVSYASSLTLMRSTVSGNSAGVQGGGILVDGTGGGASLHAVNSTVTGNRAATDGGGIAAINGAEANINGVTVARNIADSDANMSGLGGGLFQESGSAISSRNSLLALNTINDSTTTGLDCYGATNFTTGGHNLRTHANGCTGFNGTGDIVRHNPRIGQLASNGGPTQTIALKPGSPAIDRGGSSAPGHDQRGVAAHGKRDIGAFEFVP